MDYILGRGKLYVGDRYVGNTPRVRVAPDAIYFSTNDISDENLSLFFNGGSGDISYVACNPEGRNIDYSIVGAKIEGCPSDLKDDSWMALNFIARGAVTRYIRPAN